MGRRRLGQRGRAAGVWRPRGCHTRWRWRRRRYGTARTWPLVSIRFSPRPACTPSSRMAQRELQRKYLPKLVTWELSGSMQLTEPQAGSDLRFVRTRAAPGGRWILQHPGTKIFITYGEHPMTENIIHLVLARLPDAPEGTKGLSLFIVPKFFVSDDGSIGPRNDVTCAKLEHKLGIHGSPTAVMNYGDHGGATGWLVGAPHNGLARDVHHDDSKRASASPYRA